MIYDIEEELEKYELAKNDLSKVPADKWEHTEVITDLNGKSYTAGIKDGVSWKLQPDEEEENQVVASNTPSITDIEREKQIALKADLNLVKPDPNAPLPRIISDLSKGTLRAGATVGENTTSLAANVLGAPGDLGNYLARLAGNEDYKGIVPGSEAINNKIQGVLSWIDTNVMGNNSIDTWAAEPYNNETLGKITEGLAQFIIPAIPAAKLVKAGDMIVNGMISLSPMVRGMTWGAIADTLAFPANEELITKNLAEYFVGKTPEERTEFANEIMAIFEKNPEHAEIFNTLKNTVEGLVIGGVLEGTLRSIPFLRTAVRAAKGIKWKELYDRIEFDPNTLSSGGFGSLKLGSKKPTIKASEKPFYSVVEETIENLPMEKGSGMQLFNTIKNSKGVKPEELKWSGLKTFLKDKKTVTKEEMLNHMKANRLEIKEVTRSNDALRSYEDIEIRMESLEASEPLAREEISHLSQEHWDMATNNFEETLETMVDQNYITNAEVSDVLNFALDNGGVDSVLNARNTNFKTFQIKFNEMINDKAYADYEDFPLYTWTDTKSRYTITGNDHGFWATDNMGRTIELEEPTNIKETIRNVKDDMEKAGHLDYVSMKPKHTDYQLGEEGVDFENPREFIVHEPNVSVMQGNTFTRSAHFPEENPFFHYRTNDRITKGGKKTLFVEEIQSDLHQAGRDQGYWEPELVEQKLKNMNSLKAKLDELEKAERKWLDVNLLIRTMDGGIGTRIGAERPVAFFKELEKTHSEKFKNAIEDLKDKSFKARQDYNTVTDGIINIPLKTNWHETAFRRIVRRAAKEGYDSVTWTPGSVQSARYPGDKKLVEGMAAFYDGKIKKYAEKWGKKFGAKVNVTTVKRGDANVEVWQINITPEMRESVVTKGVPFYGIPAAIGAEQMLNQEAETTQNNTI